MEQEKPTIYITKDMLTSGWPSTSITADSNVCCTMYNPLDDKLKKYCNSTDKHLDELEEDIEFLDKMRKDTNGQLALHNDKIGELESKISYLQAENVKLRTDLDELYSQIYILQQKLDNQ